MIDSTRPDFRVNFKGEALDYLIEGIAGIQPDQIQLNTPTRPTMEKHIKPVNSTTLSVVEKRIKEVSPDSEIMRVDRERVLPKPIKRVKEPLKGLRGDILALLKSPKRRHAKHRRDFQ
ncbi:MAG TPA: hypothetical protein EYP68_01730 [Candidatus Korarchaeota archaeon]|nr:hypothetical protein [Candidatus Korarchaeota archaeon]